MDSGRAAAETKACDYNLEQIHVRRFSHACDVANHGARMPAPKLTT